jgi:gluconokinase
MRGQVLSQASKSYRVIANKEGHHELDPKILFEAVLQVMTASVKQSSGHSLEGISFSAAMHGLIAVDESGDPLTNMITWADLRSNEYARRLKNEAIGRKLYERTGTPNHAMSPLCKLMWLKDNEPEIFSKAFKFISIKEYIFFHLFGEFIVDHSIASSTGLFDIHDLEWNADALATAGITAAKLSRHVNSTFIIKGVNKKYADITGVSQDTPFIIGASDGCLAHLGSNALRAGDVSLTIGTSGAVRMMTDKPVPDTGQRVFNYLLTDDHYLSGGPVNNGGNVLQWFAKGFLKKEFLVPEEFEGFIKQALSVSPGCEGLVFLPYIYGERAPVWDADAKGVFYGVSSVHGMSHFMRAVMEGISFALFSILHTLEEIMGPVNNIYASGGFIRSKPWVSMLTDVLGKKVTVTHAEDSSAAGAAILGMKSLGLIKDLQEVQSFFSVKEVYEPDMDHHNTYLRNYSVYSNLYAKLKDIN